MISFILGVCVGSWLGMFIYALILAGRDDFE